MRAVIANAMETQAKTESSYKQIQRFLKSFKWRRLRFCGVSIGIARYYQCIKFV